MQKFLLLHKVIDTEEDKGGINQVFFGLQMGVDFFKVANGDNICAGLTWHINREYEFFRRG